MSSLFFWFVYFTLDDVYKVKAVFIVVLDKTTGQHIIFGQPALISLLVVFVNKVCDFNGIVFTEKGVCRIEI